MCLYHYDYPNMSDLLVHVAAYNQRSRYNLILSSMSVYALRFLFLESQLIKVNFCFPIFAGPRCLYSG